MGFKKLLASFVLLVGASIFTNGCSTPSYMATEYIRTPTYCNLEMPARPEIKNDKQHLTEDFAKVLKYTDELEMTLYCCRGDKRCFTKD